MDLVILAAGMGSRFGGNKQTEPIDDDGNFILDYSVYDAVRAGFDRVILIIRREDKDVFDRVIGERLGKIVKVEYAFQDMNDIPSGARVPKERIRPWGTAHALFAARDVVSDKFAVINADDFYGHESFQIIADKLKTSGEKEFCCAGYILKNTLSNDRALKRGIIEVQGRYATNVIESNIEIRDGKIFASPLNKNQFKQISEDTIVSMTMFGFSKKIIDEIEERSNEFFFQDEETLKTAEFLLPEVVGNMIGKISLEVIKTPAKWFGLTYKEDLKGDRAILESMKKANIYPKHLYN